MASAFGTDQQGDSKFAKISDTVRAEWPERKAHRLRMLKSHQNFVVRESLCGSLGLPCILDQQIAFIL